MTDSQLSELLTDIPKRRERHPDGWQPSLEFDGSEGVATLPPSEGVPDFDSFLIEQGFDPAEYEVVGAPRTSRWQRYDGEWLCSYRFNFRRKVGTVDLPLLLAEARKSVKRAPLPVTSPRALVVLWSDLQVGKVDYRGNSDSLIARVDTMQQRLIKLIKEQKPERIVFCDLGDTVEGFDNKANMQQLYSNDLSIMQQVDLATTFAWQTLKVLHKLVADITYVSVGSNHCQWRKGGQAVGLPTDDWGVFIGRQLARLSDEAGMGIRFVEPEPHRDNVAHDVFGDGFHILGVVHGHQKARPDLMGEWWRGQAFGNQPVSEATLRVHGHWHHLRVTELGSTPRGTSRFIVMAPTLDNGSGWWRQTSGEDSVPGLACLTLEQGIDFTGTVYKL